MATSTASPRTQFSYWPYGIVVFFLCLFAGGIALYKIAASGPSEWLEGNPYEDGMKYQQVIEQGQRFAALGWAARFEASADGAVSVHLTDSSRAPLSVAAATLYAMRPGDSKMDQRVALIEAKPGQGVYYAPELSLSRGLWVLDLQVATPGGVARYRSKFVRD